MSGQHENSLQGESSADLDSYSNNQLLSTDSLPDLVSSVETSLTSDTEYVPNDVPRTSSPAFSDTSEPSFTNVSLMPVSIPELRARLFKANFERDSILNEFNFEHSKYRKACTQLTTFNSWIEDTDKRYKRAVANGNNRFAYVLKDRLTIIKHVKEMYIEFAYRSEGKLNTYTADYQALRLVISDINAQIASLE